MALVWNGARLRGIDPVKAAALVGLNPLIVVYGIGGGHNDLLMLAPMVAGIVLLLQRRGRLGAGSIVLGAAIKVTAGMMLPFALADARGRMARARRRDLLIGAGVAAALLAVFAFVLFGTGPLHLPATIEKVQSKGNWQSIPGFIGARLGLGSVGQPAALVLGAVFAVALVLAALARVARRARLDRRCRLGGGRAARHGRVAPALVRSVADAAGRARTGPSPVAGVDPADRRDRMLPATRLHPARKLGARTVSRP